MLRGHELDLPLLTRSSQLSTLMLLLSLLIDNDALTPKSVLPNDREVLSHARLASRA